MVEEGESLIITSHHTPLAKIVRLNLIKNSSLKGLTQLEGVKWDGKKPKGGKLNPKISGKSASDYVLEGRRVFALRAYVSIHLATAHYFLKEGNQDVIFACFDYKLNRAAIVLGLKLLAIDKITP